MAKHFIFNSNNNIERIAPTDEIKNNFISNQNIYTAIEVSDIDYFSVKKGTKTATLVNGSVVLTNELKLNEPFYLESIQGNKTHTLEEVKTILNNFIAGQKQAWISLQGFNYNLIQDALTELDRVNAYNISSIPDKTPQEWLLTQPGFPDKVPFELLA